MADDRVSSNGQSRLVSLLIVGVIAVAATAGVAAWIGGAFKPRDKVGLLTWNDDPYWDMVIRGAQDAAKTEDVDLIVVRSQPDPKVQTQHLQDLLAQNCRGIAISPNNPSAQKDALYEAGTKCVLVTFDSDAAIPNRKAFIGADNYTAGQTAAEEIRRAIPDGGEIILSVGGVDMDNGRDRRRGIIDNLLNRRPNVDAPLDPLNDELKGDRYTIVTTIVDGGDSARAVTGVAEAIKAHPAVKCIAGLFSYNAPAIVKAVEQAGKSDAIQVIGFDESDETQAGVESGKIYSSILQDQYNCGYQTVGTLREILRGSDPNAPSRFRAIHLRLSVMKRDNLATLRAERVIHVPGVKAS